MLTLLPGSLLPWQNPVWLQWVSHKLLRLAVPWALMVMFSCNVSLLSDVLYLGLFTAQVGGYFLASLGLFPALGRGRVLGGGASFMGLNAAPSPAFLVW